MKQSLSSVVHAYRKFGHYKKHEWIDIILSSIVFGFVFSFKMWGDETFNLFIGLYNWSLFSLFSFFSILVLNFGYKFMALKFGYNTEYKVWKKGLFLNLLVSFLTNGAAIFLIPGSFNISRNEALMSGKLHFGIEFKEKAFLVFWSFFALVVYVLLAKMFFPLNVAKAIATTSFIIAFWMLIPMDLLLIKMVKDFPPSYGTSILWSMWSFAIFVVSFLVISALLVFKLTSFWPLLISLLISIFIYFLFYLWFDPRKGNRVYK